MKKLIIFTDSLMRGGAERVAVSLADYFTRNGTICVIVSLRKGENEYNVPNGVERIIIPDGGTIAKIRGLRKILREQNADVMLVMGTPLCIYAVSAGIGLKGKVVISERNDPNHFPGKPATKVLSRLLMTAADGFVFQTEEAKRYYARRLGGRGAVIFNPLLTDRLPEAYTGPRRKSVVSMGRLAPQKNQKMLISAFAALAEDYPEYDLTIYGDGALKDALQQQAEQFGIEDRVHLPGNQQNVLEIIKDATVFVMSSDYEGMPNALIEAMAIGMPCICTDCPCGGPRELMEDGENGLLVPVGDAKAMESALRRMLDDSQWAQRMGMQAVAIREKLHVERIGRQWMEYITQI